MNIVYLLFYCHKKDLHVRYTDREIDIRRKEATIGRKEIGGNSTDSNIGKHQRCTCRNKARRNSKR